MDGGARVAAGQGAAERIASALGPYELAGRLGTALPSYLATRGGGSVELVVGLELVERCEHPRIIPVEDAGGAGSSSWVAYAWIDRVASLSDLIEAASGGLPARDVACLIAGVAHALAAMHAGGVVHGTLTPDAIRIDARGNVRLARACARSTSTASGEQVGFTAPERFVDGCSSARSDVFALGACAFAALTGSPPFRGRTELELVARICRGARPRVRDLRPDAPPALVQTIERALAIEHDERIESAEELAALLAPIAGSEAALSTWWARARPSFDAAAVAPLECEVQPARAAARARRSRVAPPCAAIVGRRMELDTVAGALERARLVTLVGPPGIGKTRVAREACEAWSGTGASAIWISLPARARLSDLVDLAAHHGVPSANGPAALLVLDGFEHLAASARATLRAWLEEDPSVRMLVTSRTALGVAGEERLEIGPLGWEGAASDAAELFRARASQRWPGLAITPERVARIVAAFEGNPLAIELAAARAGVDTSPETPALGEALDDAVRRSWRLLSLNARRAFARLAVVAGPFDAPLARAVLGDVPFDTVTALLEHSLLRPHAEGLWTMPATLRPFALARLDEEGRLEEAQHALVAHHAEVGRSIDEHDPRWDLRRRELAATIESHLEAVRLATDLEVDPEAALACARAAATLLGYSGPYAHALRIVESALDSPPGPTDCSRLRSQLAILRARLLNLVGRNDDACAAAREAAIAAEATGDASLVARAHDVAALVFLRTHALDEARAHAVRGIEVAAHEDEVACTLYGRLGRIDLQCMQIESARA